MSFWDTALTVAFPVPYLANKFAAKVISKPKTTAPQVATTQGQTSNYVTADMSNPNTAQTSVNINSDRNDIFLIGGLALAGVLVAILCLQSRVALPRPHFPPNNVRYKALTI